MEAFIHQGTSQIPRFFYGTAWKEERTATLTSDAIKAGFRAIDTANQRKHYFEEGVGAGIQMTAVPRSELFLQTKFTYARGQDHRKPYKETDSFTQQVSDSFQSSLAHLHTDYLDSYVLHGPYGTEEISEEDMETWTAMEFFHEKKKTRFLGVSNVSAAQLRDLLDAVKIKPTFVQNRCYASGGWDKEVREICKASGMLYQGFSLLTANRSELADEFITALAQKYSRTVPQIIFRFCQQVGMICLTGTTNPAHMKEDLNISDFELSDSEVVKIEAIAF